MLYSSNGGAPDEQSIGDGGVRVVDGLAGNMVEGLDGVEVKPNEVAKLGGATSGG
jgi:hypothetical protein